MDRIKLFLKIFFSFKKLLIIRVCLHDTDVKIQFINCLQMRLWHIIDKVLELRYNLCKVGRMVYRTIRYFNHQFQTHGGY